MPGDRHEERRRHELRLALALQAAYAEAVLSGAAARAESVIRDAIEAGLDEATIDDHIIRPALLLVGDLWADGELSVVEEHLATSISRRVIALQREAFRVARQRASERVLLAAVQGELHVVGLEMAANVLLHAGYDVRMLGADVPVVELPGAVLRHRPAVLGLSTASAITSVNALSAIDAVRERGLTGGIVVGGRGAEERWAQHADVVVCRHVTDAIALVDGLVQRAAHN